MMKVALILNGENLDTQIKEDIIVCADGGYRHVVDKKVHAIIGDFDSLKIKPEAENIIVLPVKKDVTDGEQTIEYCKSIGATAISIYSFAGGRLDHQIANIYLLLKAHYLEMEAIAKSKKEDIYLLTSKLSIDVAIGDYISIIPCDKSCVLKTSKGLYYKTENLELNINQIGLGISNYSVENKVYIEILKGKAFVFHNKSK